MNIIGLMPARNEECFLEFVVRAAMRWCDHLVVLNHASVDDTVGILARLSDLFDSRISILSEDDPVWNEMIHRQRLLEWARQEKATHIAMIDADEVLTGNLLPTIRERIAAAATGTTVQLPWICLRGALDRHYLSGPWSEQNVSMAFRDEPRCHWAARDGYHFHHREPMGRPLIPFRPVSRFDGGLMHLQFVNERRLKAKQALYKMTERIRWPDRDSIATINARYDLAVYGDFNRGKPVAEPLPGQVVTPEQAVAILRARRNPPAGPPRLGPTPKEWWAAYDDLVELIDLTDKTPWQEDECRRLVDLHGAEAFADLDLFDVVHRRS